MLGIDENNKKWFSFSLADDIDGDDTETEEEEESTSTPNCSSENATEEEEEEKEKIITEKDKDSRLTKKKSTFMSVEDNDVTTSTVSLSNINDVNTYSDDDDDDDDSKTSIERLRRNLDRTIDEYEHECEENSGDVNTYDHDMAGADVDDDDTNDVTGISRKRIKQFDVFIRDNLDMLFTKKVFPWDPSNTATTTTATAVAGCVSSNTIKPAFRRPVDFCSDDVSSSSNTKNGKNDRDALATDVVMQAVPSHARPVKIPLSESVLTSSGKFPPKAAKCKTFGLGFAPFGAHAYVAVTPRMSKVNLCWRGATDDDERAFTSEIMGHYTSVFSKNNDDVTCEDFFSEFSQLYASRNKYRHIFRLLEVLLSNKDSKDARFASFGDWLRDALYEKTEVAATKLAAASKYEEACFVCLCGGQVERAVSMAILSSNQYLATIIPTLPHYHVRSLLYHQLEEWHRSLQKRNKNSNDSCLEPSLERIYVLLSGKFQDLGTDDYWKDLDWLTYMGAYYWYGNTFEGNLSAFLENFRVLTEEKKSLPFPAPTLYSADKGRHVTDSAYAMMMSITSKDKSLVKCSRDVLNPEGYSVLGKNNVVSWVLVKFFGEVTGNYKHITDVAVSVRAKVLYSFVDQLARNDLYHHRSFLIENEYLPIHLDRASIAMKKKEEECSNNSSSSSDVTSYAAVLKAADTLSKQGRYMDAFEKLLRGVLLPAIVKRDKNIYGACKFLESIFTANNSSNIAYPQPIMFVDYMHYVEAVTSEKWSRERALGLMRVADALVEWGSECTVNELERTAISVMGENTASAMQEAIVEVKFAEGSDNSNNDDFVKELVNRINKIPMSNFHRRMILSDLSVL